jgi:hypothetical protein
LKYNTLILIKEVPQIKMISWKNLKAGFPPVPISLLSLISILSLSQDFYLVLKNLVLPRVAGFSMGLACPALRESEFFGSA